MSGAIDSSGRNNYASAIETQAPEEKEAEELFLFGLPFNPVRVAPAEFWIDGDEDVRQHGEGWVPGGGNNQEQQQDDEVQIVGQTGCNAITDWPHPRESCALKPFVVTDVTQCRETCPKCYCYVCDVIASACPAWELHCVATRKNPTWVAERERLKLGGAPLPLFGNTEARDRQLLADSRVKELTALVLRYQLRTLVQDCEPPGLSRPLTESEKRVVAIALAIERREGRRAQAETARGNLFAVASPTCIAALHLTTQTSPSHAAEQALAALCRGLDADDRASAALVGRISFKTTILVTSRTRCRAWALNLARAAPFLNVGVYQGDVQQRSFTWLRGVDVLLVVSVGLPRVVVDCVRFRRLIVDPSHVGYQALSFANNYSAASVWLISTHPPASNLGWLLRAAKVLGRDSLTFRSAIQAFEQAELAPLAHLLSQWVVYSPSDVLAGTKNDAPRSSSHLNPNLTNRPPQDYELSSMLPTSAAPNHNFRASIPRSRPEHARLAAQDTRRGIQVGWRSVHGPYLHVPSSRQQEHNAQQQQLLLRTAWDDTPLQ